MSHLFTSRLRMLVVALVALAVVAMPATAAAKGGKKKDRNHDGIADKWAKKHKLGKGKGVAKKDPDADGLTNLVEFRAALNPRKADTDGDGVGDANEDGDSDSVDNANEVREKTHPAKADSDRDGIKDGREDADRDKLDNAGEDVSGNDPINPDSDDDGVKDGEEGAGQISAFDGTTLTITIFGGATLSGTVDEATSIWCDDADLWGDEWEKRAARVVATDDEYGDDEDPFADDDEDWSDEDEDWGDEEDEDWGDDAECSTDDLQVGVVVRGASLDFDEEGTFFSEVELVK